MRRYVQARMQQLILSGEDLFSWKGQDQRGTLSNVVLLTALLIVHMCVCRQGMGSLLLSLALRHQSTACQPQQTRLFQLNL